MHSRNSGDPIHCCAPTTHRVRRKVLSWGCFGSTLAFKDWTWAWNTFDFFLNQILSKFVFGHFCMIKKYFETNLIKKKKKKVKRPFVRTCLWFLILLIENSLLCSKYGKCSALIYYFPPTSWYPKRALRWPLIYTFTQLFIHRIVLNWADWHVHSKV